MAHSQAQSRRVGMLRAMHALCLAAILAVGPTLASAQNAVSAPRGVNPQDAHLYVPNRDDGESWSCLDGSATIPASAINDDYCDCADSSDEPGTSACPKARFYCANEGHIPAYVLSSRVNDGICDPECCDGSDEYDGKISCPNVCAKVGKEYRKRKQEQENLRRAGAKVRAGYIRETKHNLETLQAEVASLEVEIEVAREVERTRKLELEKAERADQAIIELKKKSPLYATLRAHQDGLKALQDREDVLKEELQRLTSLLDDLSSGYNPNYQDMAVKGAVMAYRSWRKGGQEEAEGAGVEATGDEDEVASSDTVADTSKDSSAAPVGENIRLQELLDEGSWPRSKIYELHSKETLELMDDEMFKGSASQAAKAAGSSSGSILFRLHEYLPDTLVPVFDGAIDGLLDILVKAHILSGFQRAPRSSRSPSPDLSSSSEEPESVTAARKLFVDAESHTRSISSQLSTKRGQLDVSPERWGLEGEWKPLSGKCIERNMGEYTYEYCFFGTATQKPNKSGSHVSLGRFSHFEGNTTHNDPGFFSQQKYDRGQRCWNGPERSVIVTTVCGSDNALLDVFEAEKCIYSMKVATPAVCYPVDEEQKSQTQAPAKSARDEL